MSRATPSPAGPTPPTAAHYDFTGRTALITGASRGIGYGIAEALLRSGASVAITGRKPDTLQQAATSLAQDTGSGPDRVLAVPGNAGDEQAQQECVDTVLGHFGSLDVLVNNTGINPVFGGLMDMDLAAVRKIFDVNVVAALGFTQRAWHGWMSEHGGAVVNLGSIAGVRSTGALAAYGASKAALLRLTEELAWQLAPGVRVNAVAPAVVKTRFAEALYASDEEGVASSYPMQRLGLPSDVASAVAFLASEAASWITGETLRVDGGMLATGTLG